jgi:DNA-directed RNA polymerase specialized sigma54-like protein
MTNFMEKKSIIMLKEQGLSNREVSRQTGHDRKTVSKYWEEYRQKLQKLEEPGVDVKEIQESLLVKPKYNAANRVRRKYTEELDKRLKEILKEEERKDRLFGPGHKQKLTNNTNLRSIVHLLLEVRPTLHGRTSNNKCYIDCNLV